MAGLLGHLYDPRHVDHLQTKLASRYDMKDRQTRESNPIASGNGTRGIQRRNQTHFLRQQRLLINGLRSCRLLGEQNCTHNKDDRPYELSESFGRPGNGLFRDLEKVYHQSCSDQTDRAQCRTSKEPSYKAIYEKE
jgi:hypothetical protein